MSTVVLPLSYHDLARSVYIVPSLSSLRDWEKRVLCRSTKLKNIGSRLAGTCMVPRFNLHKPLYPVFHSVSHSLLASFCSFVVTVEVLRDTFLSRNLWDFERGIALGVKEINRMNVERQKRDDAHALKWPACKNPTNSCHGSLGWLLLLVPRETTRKWVKLLARYALEHEEQEATKINPFERRLYAFVQVVLSSLTNCSYRYLYGGFHKCGYPKMDGL